jgi:hypothetical protein
MPAGPIPPRSFASQMPRTYDEYLRAKEYDPVFRPHESYTLPEPRARRILSALFWLTALAAAAYHLMR